MSILFISIIISFCLTLLVLPLWIKKCKKINLLWEDMNKFGHPKNVASSGGVVVILAFVLGVLSYIAIRTFIYTDITGISLQIFALLSVILVLALIGLTDDLLGWHQGGLSARIRILLFIMASIPLIVINAGESAVNFSWISFDLGSLYPLFLVPLGIVGATAVYNFLAGFNGLEAGQGIIILSFLSFVSYKTGNPWLSVVGLCMVGALIGFYIYNKVPAKVFPGDIMTYSVGALIAGMAILGNFERIAVFVFIPYILEAGLKIRGKLKKQSFGIAKDDGSLKMPYGNTLKDIYGLTHVSIYLLNKFKIKATEQKVTYLIFGFQIFICLLAMIIFRGALF